MLVFLNGQLVPEEQAVVSVFDRCFLFGDGLFETLLVRNGRPFRWEQHLQRLWQGAEFLKIQMPFEPEPLRGFVDQLATANRLPNALLRLTLSRGVGVRGYSPAGANRPSLVMTLHPAPASETAHAPRWRLLTASPRLVSNDPLAQFKTCNKLAQILARAEAEAAHAHEALLVNTDGHVVEAASSNLFWLANGTVFTPPLASGILAGITRAVVFEICRGLRLSVREAAVLTEHLRQAEGVFLSLSSVGIAEGIALDGKPLRKSPTTERIWTAYARLVKSETDSAL
jgi:aminodeoxychorismate lyase